MGCFLSTVVKPPMKNKFIKMWTKEKKNYFGSTSRNLWSFLKDRWRLHKDVDLIFVSCVVSSLNFLNSFSQSTTGVTDSESVRVCVWFH